MPTDDCESSWHKTQGQYESPLGQSQVSIILSKTQWVIIRQNPWSVFVKDSMGNHKTKCSQYLSKPLWVTVRQNPCSVFVKGPGVTVRQHKGSVYVDVTVRQYTRSVYVEVTVRQHKRSAYVEVTVRHHTGSVYVEDTVRQHTGSVMSRSLCHCTTTCKVSYVEFNVWLKTTHRVGICQSLYHLTHRVSICQGHCETTHRVSICQGPCFTVRPTFSTVRKWAHCV